MREYGVCHWESRGREIGWQGVQELRIHYGPGYRVYFTKRRDEYILLLAGGDKSSQDEDIRKAHALNVDL